ncbi:MAG: alpha/beta hydrolase-fold protein [Weeksellaceae bacterium]|nr:alpha/beta hydrolase-fold protein [Weeksellaceae bacterium]
MSNKNITFFLTTDVVDDRPIYITGPFNGWNPHDEKFRLSKSQDNQFSITIQVNSESNVPFEYKYTKGGWENVEIDIHGNIHPNRKIKGDQVQVFDHVSRWRENWAPFKAKYFPIVELISDEFEIPQLNRTRRVWALLPYNYHQTTQRYPVLYLQDAQNLFNEGSPYGNWEIDKKLSILAEYGRGEIIIIAVEHGGEERIKEYMLDHNSLMQHGEGKKYIRFITDTLKYYVDKRYRTLPDREHTGIGGSSLGGLISIYGGLLYPEVYSKLMVFSPSLWAIPQISFPTLRFFNPFNTKVYLYGGKKEGSNMVSKIRKFSKQLEYHDQDDERNFEMKLSINPEGKHNEYYWSQEFPKAMEWLYFNTFKDPVETVSHNSHNHTSNS